MNPDNYALVNTAPVGKGSTLADTAMPMSVAMSPSSSSVVVLTPAQPLPINRFFRLELNAGAGGLQDLGDNMLAGDGSTPGTAYTAMLARGTSLKYSTPAGDQVSLKINGGGYLDDLLSGSGQGVRLTVVGEVPHHTVLSGSIRKLRGGTGQAYLGSTIWGLGNFGDVRVKLQSPPFQVSQYPFSPNSAASTAARPMVALPGARSQGHDHEPVVPPFAVDRYSGTSAGNRQPLAALRHAGNVRSAVPRWVEQCRVTRSEAHRAGRGIAVGLARGSTHPTNHPPGCSAGL